MCVCKHMYIYVYLCNVCIYAHMHVFYVYTQTYIHTCIQTNSCVPTYIYMYVCT